MLDYLREYTERGNTDDLPIIEPARESHCSGECRLTGSKLHGRTDTLDHHAPYCRGATEHVAAHES